MRIVAAIALSFGVAVAPAYCQVPPPPSHGVEWHRNTPCPDFPNVWGCAYRPNAEGVVHVYLSPEIPYEALDDVAWHEAAHVYDYLVMQDNARAEWLRINRPRDNVQTWWDGINSPAEQFAESYRLCMMGRTAMPYRAYHYMPTRRALRRTCQLLRGL